MRSLHPERKVSLNAGTSFRVSHDEQHGKNHRCDMLSKSLAVHIHEAQIRNSPAGSCVSIVLQASYQRVAAVQAIEAIMREKCEVLALLAAPAWRRGGSTNIFWEESVKKMSRKCLAFQICRKQSIGNQFQENRFQKHKN